MLAGGMRAASDRDGVYMDRTDAVRRPTSAMQRLVIVADNSLIVEAIRRGLRQSGEFHVLGHATVGTTSAETIVGVHPDVIVVDDMNRSELVVRLIREVKAADARVGVIVLSLSMDPGWLQQIFDAGATAAISKAIQPGVLATLVRETLNGHIVHRPPAARISAGGPGVVDFAASPPLTGRELEILRLVAAGATNGEVARTLWVTEPTVKFHLRNIYRKLDVANRTEASHLAHVNGLVGGGGMHPAVAALASAGSDVRRGHALPDR